MQPRLDAGDPGAVKNQAVRGSQRHLEKYEKIEEIAGEKGAVQAHQQELKQWMEVHSGAMPPGQREYHGRERQDACEHHHKCGKLVQDEHDYEGGRPIAEQKNGRAWWRKRGSQK